MGEVLTIAFFFVVIALTAVVFFGWIVFTIVRALLGGITGLFLPRQPRMAISHAVSCVTRGCGATNPSAARFCRRCGHGMPAAQRVQVRRAAVW